MFSSLSAYLKPYALEEARKDHRYIFPPRDKKTQPTSQTCDKYDNKLLIKKLH